MPKNSRRRSGRRMRVNRRRLGGSSEGFSRRATTSVAVGVTITGNQGITFTPEQLLRKYFQDPRLVRINGYRIRINILDFNQPFLQYQCLCKMDYFDGPLVTVTQPRTITMQRSVQTVRIARDRTFWIESVDETHTVLDIKFLAFATTKLVIEVTTYFNIEQDLVTSLAAIDDKVPYNIVEPFESISDTASVTAKMKDMGTTRVKRLK